MPIRYRSFLGIEPATNPIAVTSLEDTLLRSSRFTQETGIPHSQIVVSPAFFVPIPIYSPTENRRAWPVKPEAMWHPLMWLPDRLAAPVSVENPTTETSQRESAEEYGVRVCYELANSAPFLFAHKWWVRLEDYAGVPIHPYDKDETGADIVPDAIYDPSATYILRPADGRDTGTLLPIYNQAEGTWLDVPYLVGVDTQSRDGVERMRAWLVGMPDEALDSLNLDTYLLAGDRDPNWAMNRFYRLIDQSAIGGEVDGTLFMDTIIDTAHMSTLSDLSVWLEQAKSLMGEDLQDGRDYTSFTRENFTAYSGLPHGGKLFTEIDAAFQEALTESEPVETLTRIQGMFMDVARELATQAELYNLCLETLLRDTMIELLGLLHV
ncbi:hypothetical protein [Changpingibacter yushuensis]|uniref:hypothetical protein n=1 Tax=Changpingibacter yushuensis TaxID=2758440 RepID=UPI0015F47638|nr:hypothetical protein [Changpingibacter yushuensis]